MVVTGPNTTNTTNTTRSKKLGPSLLVALVVLGIGVLLAVPAAVFVGIRGFQVLDPPSVAIPGTTQRQLAKGRWVVYQLTGTSNAGFTFNNNNNTGLQPGQVTVTGPDGSQLAVQWASDNDTITKSSDVFTSAVEFTVSSPGRYTLSFDTPTSGEVLVSRSLGDTLSSLAGWGLAIGVGGLLILTGLVLLFVGIFRRSGAAHAALAGAPAPGWYSDPHVPGARRWWDGTRWSEYHV